MDLGTIIGIILGVTLVTGSIMMSASIMTFVDVPSVAIVVGGTFAAAMISFPLKQLLKVISVSKKLFLAKAIDPVDYVRTLVKLAEVARRDGILSLESHLNEGSYDEFLKRGLHMAIDGQDPAVIQAAMEKEVESVMERHASGKQIFDTLGKYAPAFGMIGTLIGLVIMLQNMEDPSALGPAMAVALITTFYGALISNMFAMPMADKLAIRSADEVAAKLLIIHGVMSIQAGDNPRIVQQKLLAFLDVRQRKVAESEAKPE